MATVTTIAIDGRAVASVLRFEFLPGRLPHILVYPTSSGRRWTLTHRAIKPAIGLPRETPKSCSPPCQTPEPRR